MKLGQPSTHGVKRVKSATHCEVCGLEKPGMVVRMECRECTLRWEEYRESPEWLADLVWARSSHTVSV